MDQSRDAGGDSPAAELIDRFALFREQPVLSAAASDPVVARTMERMMAVMGERWGLVPARATTVDVTPDITMVVIPGTAGVGVLIGERRADGSPGRWGSGADLEVVFRGDPICESGRPDGSRMIFGLAPDGVAEQPILRADGSTIQAPVTRNVYAVVAP